MHQSVPLMIRSFFAIFVGAFLYVGHAGFHKDHQAQLQKNTLNNLQQLNCLTKNIYFEAGHESFTGKLAVAQVTMNRVESGKFPNDICAVVQQKTLAGNRKVICQFSWFCNAKHRNKAVNHQHWTESQRVAEKVFFEGLRIDKLTKALYYHANYVRPHWQKQRIVQIGKHIFYR
jgi:spore germination cell wall hydrolase CwlJ-like protein